MTHKPKQRETLFTSEEERQAEIEELQKQVRHKKELQVQLEYALSSCKEAQENLSCRIQELQNLDIFED